MKNTICLICILLFVTINSYSQRLPCHMIPATDDNTSLMEYKVTNNFEGYTSQFTYSGVGGNYNVDFIDIYRLSNNGNSNRDPQIYIKSLIEIFKNSKDIFDIPNGLNIFTITATFPACVPITINQNESTSTLCGLECCTYVYTLEILNNELKLTNTLYLPNQTYTCGTIQTCLELCPHLNLPAPMVIASDFSTEILGCEDLCYWRLNGNNVFTGMFMGSINDEDVVFKSNNEERMRIKNDGKISFGGGVTSDIFTGKFDFNLNTFGNTGLPKVSFASGIGDAPMLKLYNPNGITCSTDPNNFIAYPWWIAVDQQNGSHSGAFNLWTGNPQCVGEEDENTMDKVLSILRNGNVGIGTEVPSGNLDIDLGESQNLTRIIMNKDFNNPSIRLYRDATGGGNQSHSWWLTVNRNTGENFTRFQIKNNSNVSGGNIGQETSTSTMFTILENGNVGIGSADPTYKFEVSSGSIFLGGETKVSGKLKVNNEIYGTEMWIKQSSEFWPDYVFENSYNLRSMDDLETFINENGHLPEVPTKDEVEKNSLSINQMQALLLKKIEELTLYMLELKKENDKLKSILKNDRNVQGK